MGDYFLTTARLGFSRWSREDGALAAALWGEAEVTRYICASGVFTPAEIQARLETEVRNGEAFGVQYFPVFLLETGELAGCCGLRPAGEDGVYELGCHLRRAFWGQGIALEAGQAVIAWAFSTLRARRLEAGHHPKNLASGKVLKKLGFQYDRDRYYAPTGLMHPDYHLDNPMN